MKKHLGTEYIPNPVGISLTAEQKNQIAYTIYSRYVRTGDLPDWASPLAVQIRKNLMANVDQVLDALELNGFRIEL